MKNILVTLSLCLLSFAAQAQSYNMGGTVYDNAGETLPGVTVMIKGSSVATMSNSEGKFQIKASKGDIIVFSMVAFKNVEYKVEKEEPELEIRFLSVTELDEVVVTGLSTQRKISVVGAITSVKVSEIQTPATSLTNMMGGRMPGVISMMSSGEPG